MKSAKEVLLCLSENKQTKKQLLLCWLTPSWCRCIYCQGKESSVLPVPYPALCPFSQVLRFQKMWLQLINVAKRQTWPHSPTLTVRHEIHTQANHTCIHKLCSTLQTL